MKFYNIDSEVEPKITGSRNGVYSVEIKNKYSFATQEDKNIWNDYFSQNRKHRQRVLIDGYTPLDASLLSTAVTYFPIGKRIKQLDFMAYCPYERGIQFLVTQRVYEILLKYKLSIHNKIPVRIDTFEQEYYLVGFPMLDTSAIDFTQSIFFNYKQNKEFSFENEENYSVLGHHHLVKLVLKEKAPFDVINTIKGTFFLPNIIEEFRKENITGYSIEVGILEN